MKLGISRLLETSKLLNTEAGKELSELITYISDFCEQTLRALNNQLTFADNFKCVMKTVALRSGQSQAIDMGNERPVGVLVMRVISTAHRVDSLGWYVDNDGRLLITIEFTGSPTTALDVSLAIFTA